MKEKIIRLFRNTEMKRPLKWSMIGMLLLCWLLPLMLLALTMLFIVSNKMNKQIENTIEISTNKAIEMCELRINDAIVASRFASYMPNIEDCYEEYKETENKQKLYDGVTSFITQQYRYNSNFLSTMIFFMENPTDVYYTCRNVGESTFNVSVRQFLKAGIQPVYQMAKEMDTEAAFISVNNRTYMVRNIMGNNHKPYAVIVMEIDKKFMFESLQSVWGYQSCEVYLGDTPIMGNEISSSFPLDTANEIQRESTYVKGKDASFSYQTRKMEKQKMTYVVELDAKAIISEIDAVRYVFISLVAFMIPLILLVFFFFHQKITKPINSLIKATDKIAEGNFGVQIPEIYTSKEFAYLGGAFNGMSTKLQSQFEKIYSEELALKDANIMALQSQINPHFLNNTLEIINWEARMMNNFKVSGMIEALSTMLEATMNRKKQQLISLAEELSYVDAYLFIIAQRFGEKFQAEKEIDKDLLRVEVPRLIIQPIIENAVEHGMNIQRQGKVSIKIYAQQEKMYIEITDNGIMTIEDQKKIELLLSPDYEVKGEVSTSLGIRNVDQRLRIIYGEDCGLTIKSNKENHTISTIVVNIDKEKRTIKDNKWQS